MDLKSNVVREPRFQTEPGKLFDVQIQIRVFRIVKMTQPIPDYPLQSGRIDASFAGDAHRKFGQFLCRFFAALFAPESFQSWKIFSEFGIRPKILASGHCALGGADQIGDVQIFELQNNKFN